MVEVAIGWGGELERAETDVVECFVVDAVGLIGVFYQLVNRERSIVRLDYSVRYFRGGNNTESVHDPVRVLLSDLGDEEGSHARASTTSERVGQLESLQAVTALGLFAYAIKN